MLYILQYWFVPWASNNASWKLYRNTSDAVERLLLSIWPACPLIPCKVISQKVLQLRHSLVSAKKKSWQDERLFNQDFFSTVARYLKITEKVSFNIVSEASYVYILSGQRFIKKCQKWSNFASFWKPKPCGQTLLPDRSVLIGQKLVENAKINIIKCDILGDFQTLCSGFNIIQKNSKLYSAKIK